MRPDDIPCGECPAGTYAWGAVKGGINLFGECQSYLEALLRVPPCRSNPKRRCLGCMDFLIGQTFPMSDDFKRQFSGETIQN